MIWIVATLASAGVIGGMVIASVQHAFRLGPPSVLEWMSFLLLIFVAGAGCGVAVALKIGHRLPKVWRRTRETLLVPHAVRGRFLVPYQGFWGKRYWRYLEAACEPMYARKAAERHVRIYTVDGMKTGVLRICRRDFACPLHWLIGIQWVKKRYEFHIPKKIV